MTDRDRPLRPTDIERLRRLTGRDRPTGTSRTIDRSEATDRLFATAAATADGRIATGGGCHSVGYDDATKLLWMADSVTLADWNGFESLVLDRAGHGPVVLHLTSIPKPDPWN